MTHRINDLSPYHVRAVMGAALCILASACGDAPAAPPRHASNAIVPEQLGARVADASPANAALLATQPGESIRRRDVRTKAGVRYTIESVLDAAGLPREMRVLKDGQPVARVSNEWRSTASEITLERQQLVRFVAGSAATLFDSRDRGGVASLVQGPVVLPLRSATATAKMGEGAVLARGVKALEGGCEACDAKARAVEAAIDNWLLSVLAMGGATLSGNPFVAWSAYAYQLKMYRDLTRAERELDECVDRAGKPVYQS